jgi:hypothetical protein
LLEEMGVGLALVERSKENGQTEEEEPEVPKYIS